MTQCVCSSPLNRMIVVTGWMRAGDGDSGWCLPRFSFSWWVGARQCASCSVGAPYCCLFAIVCDDVFFLVCPTAYLHHSLCHYSCLDHLLGVLFPPCVWSCLLTARYRSHPLRVPDWVVQSVIKSSRAFYSCLCVDPVPWCEWVTALMSLFFSFFFIAEVFSLIKKNYGLVLAHLVVNLSSCMPASSCIVCLCNCSVQPNAVRSVSTSRSGWRVKKRKTLVDTTLVCSHWNPYKLEISGQLLTCDLKSNKISFGLGLFILIYMEFFFLTNSNLVIFVIFGFMWTQLVVGVSGEKKWKLDHTKDDSLSKNPLLEGLLLRANRQCTAHELMIRQNWAWCVRCVNTHTCTRDRFGGKQCR